VTAEDGRRPPAEAHNAGLTRALGVWDLTLLSVVAVANLNVVPVIAGAGPTTIWLWLGALLLFFLPQGIAVIELSHRMPAEGGLYVWTQEMYGDLHGFLCGWCYWTTNMFFIPTLLFYLVGIVTYIAGVGNNPVLFGCLTIGMLWLTTLANVRGAGVGKWVNNIGGVGTSVAALILIVLGIVSVARYGISLPASAFALRRMDWSTISSFGLICFGLVGLELGPVMGGEIRDPRRTVPKGVLYGGLFSGIQYIGATLAVLLAVPEQDVRALQGVLQGVDKLAARLGVGWLLLPVAGLLAISVIGSTSAWLSGSGRILFVSGLDRYLPAVFGKIHPKHHTPHVALMGIAALSSALIVMSFMGEASVREAYVTLLDLAVVLQMFSYLYLYASLARVAFGRVRGDGLFGRSRLRFAAVSGLITTALGTVVAFVPSRHVESVWRFELKMFITCALFMAVAVGLFYYYSHRRPRVEAAAMEA
jgi:amino acid transporter